MSDSFQPSGFDRATGLDGLPGTPTPEGAIVNKPNTNYFEEEATSPEIERGEQGTFVHSFKCDQATGLAIVEGIPRGTLMTDSLGVTTKVLTCRYSQLPCLMARIVITAEATTLDVPPDEFSVEAVEFNPSLFRHPRYASVVNYTTGPLVGAQIVSLIQGTVNFSSVNAQSDANALLTASQISDPDVLALAQELQQKFSNGFDTFYLAGFKVTYSYYNFLPILMNPGGYVQDPVTEGGLPFYFWSDNGTPGGNNIFTYLSETVDPILYGGGFSWLRQCDYQSYQRTWFKITQTWIGGPDGFWDAQIYGS